MSEVRQLVAGDVILGDTATLARRRNAAMKDAPQRDAASPDTPADAAIEDLVRQHARLVYRIAYAALRNPHEAEDATQETFLRVLRFRVRLPQIEDAKSWLARIAWRVAVARSKNHGRRREMAWEDSGSPVAEVVSSDTPADEQIAGIQVGEVLEKLMAALPRKLREPLVLSAIEEMSPREVAAALGINEAAVRSRVFRARNILREKLSEHARKTK
jgi:RNA polymerase sigma-70 factor, ECF subfamily